MAFRNPSEILRFLIEEELKAVYVLVEAEKYGAISVIIEKALVRLNASASLIANNKKTQMNLSYVIADLLLIKTVCRDRSADKQLILEFILLTLDSIISLNKCGIINKEEESMSNEATSEKLSPQQKAARTKKEKYGPEEFRRIGSTGGSATLAKYGPEHFKKLSLLAREKATAQK